ncbi:MAG: ketoacyl-ACP synthase III [Armatimonadetes bacterium]|nr:ketoacyl-ACP synthase III [Armatimonadota bacterium]
MSLRGATIVGVGSELPERVLTNADLEKMVDTTDEWIVSHTGIRERRILADDQTVLDLAAGAGAKAIEDAGLQPEQIEFIIVATFTGDYPLPATANLLQARLKCGQASGFDLGSGCTGFVLGLVSASALVQTATFDHVLVVAAEALTRVTNWEDRSTCVLFGDGAGAVVVGPTEAGHGVLGSALIGQGEWGHLLVIPAGGSKQPVDEEALRTHADKIVMEGHDVFRLSVRGVPVVCEQALDRAGVTADDIEWVIMHQANKRIMDAAAKRFGWDADHIPITIDKYGNTSAASMPITLDDVYRQGRMKPGDHVLFIGFGAGFALGAAVVEWTKEPPSA